ncbi:MAG TPA: serine hydrolase, partial [Leptolyngbya sp.]|nr:serine hydrolase [Leptolyngbya sp.]
MWDGTDEPAANLDRREPNRIAKLNARPLAGRSERSRRRVPASHPPQPIALSSRRRERSPKPSPSPAILTAQSVRSTRRERPDRPTQPLGTDSPETAESQKSVRPARPRTRARRSLEVVPSPAPRRPQPMRKPIAPTPKRRSALAFLYGTRLLILGIGVGVIAGTSLSIWDPASHIAISQATPEQSATPTPTPAIAQLELGEELAPLKAQIQSAIASQTQLTPGLMVVDADTHAYLDINGSTAISAASTIKFPVLVAFFQAVDEGKVRLDEPLTMRKELVATESGELQNLPVGSQFPAIEVVTK